MMHPRAWNLHDWAEVYFEGFETCVTLRALIEKRSVTMFDDYSNGKRCLNTSTPLDIGDTGCDEIGVLADTYNYMTEEIGLLMDSQREAADNLRRAEFRALQAQINPHFLYNTLDMINWLSQTGRNQEVTQAIQALSRFYKLTLSRNGLMNSIETELQHVSLYIRCV